MRSYDAVGIENAFGRLLRRGETVSRGSIFDADQFRNGDPKLIARAVAALGKFISEKAETINWQESEKAASTGAPYFPVKQGGEELEIIAKEMREIAEKEPEDYHWLIVGALVDVIAGLLEKMDADQERAD